MYRGVGFFCHFWVQKVWQCIETRILPASNQITSNFDENKQWKSFNSKRPYQSFHWEWRAGRVAYRQCHHWFHLARKLKENISKQVFMWKGTYSKLIIFLKRSLRFRKTNISRQNQIRTWASRWKCSEQCLQLSFSKWSCLRTVRVSRQYLWSITITKSGRFLWIRDINFIA